MPFMVHFLKDFHSGALNTWEHVARGPAKMSGSGVVVCFEHSCVLPPNYTGYHPSLMAWLWAPCGRLSYIFSLHFFKVVGKKK